MYKIKRIIRFHSLIFLGLAACNLSIAAPTKNEPVVIPEVNLNAQKKVVNKADKQVQTTHFTRDEIKKSPVINLSELLNQEQSMVRLTNNSGDNTETALSLRGFGDNASANSLILIDGFPLTNPSLLAPNFNSIPLSDIERIDIIQGSEGTLWGDQAVGGVINIITRHPKKLFATINTGMGSFGKAYLNAVAGDKLANGFFYKAYGFYNSTANYRDHNRQADHNGAVQSGLDYSRGTVSIYLQAYTDRTNFPGGLNATQYHDDPTQATSNVNYSYYKTQILQLLNKHELTNHWILETRLSYHNTDGNGFVFAPFYRSDELTNLSPRLIGKIADIKITTGYEGQLSNYRLSQRQVHANASTNQQNIFLQAIKPLTTYLDLTLGARGAKQNNYFTNMTGDHVGSQDNVFVTEQGLTFSASENLSFFLRRDGNFSFPKANEQSLIPGNIQALHVQTGASYEAGTEWRTEFTRTQLNIYRLELNNEIAFNPTQTETQPFGAFNNLDKTLRHGITLTESYRFTDYFWLDSQFNYVDARFAAGPNVNKLIPAVPSMTGNVGLNYAWTTNWLVKYALLYSGNRYASEDVTNSGQQIPGYWLHDVAIQYLFTPIIISFEIGNLFNQLYPAYAYYNPDTNANTYYPGTGRNYLLTFKVDID